MIHKAMNEGKPPIVVEIEGHEAENITDEEVVEIEGHEAENIIDEEDISTAVDSDLRAGSECSISEPQSIENIAKIFSDAKCKLHLACLTHQTHDFAVTKHRFLIMNKEQQFHEIKAEMMKLGEETTPFWAACKGGNLETVQWVHSNLSGLIDRALSEIRDESRESSTSVTHPFPASYLTAEGMDHTTPIFSCCVNTGLPVLKWLKSQDLLDLKHSAHRHLLCQVLLQKTQQTEVALWLLEDNFVVQQMGTGDTHHLYCACMVGNFDVCYKIIKRCRELNIFLELRQRELTAQHQSILAAIQAIETFRFSGQSLEDFAKIHHTDPITNDSRVLICHLLVDNDLVRDLADSRWGFTKPVTALWYSANIGCLYLCDFFIAKSRDSKRLINEPENQDRINKALHAEHPNQGKQVKEFTREGTGTPLVAAYVEGHLHVCVFLLMKGAVTRSLLKHVDERDAKVGKSESKFQELLALIHEVLDSEVYNVLRRKRRFYPRFHSTDESFSPATNPSSSILSASEDSQLTNAGLSASSISSDNSVVTPITPREQAVYDSDEAGYQQSQTMARPWNQGIRVSTTTRRAVCEKSSFMEEIETIKSVSPIITESEYERLQNALQSLEGNRSSASRRKITSTGMSS